MATVSGGTEGTFREFVLLVQNDVNMRTDQSLGYLCEGGAPSPGAGQGWPVESLGCMEDPEDTGQKALNYRTEPLWKRMRHAPGRAFPATDNDSDWWDVLSNAKVGGEPQTPIFLAPPAQLVRFRLLMPGGHSRNMVFSLAGHVWDKEPYVQDSTRLGRNNAFSFYEGAHMGHGPSNHFDILLRNGAGGKFSVTGDYLFRDQAGPGVDHGLWGILRVN